MNPLALSNTFIGHDTDQYHQIYDVLNHCKSRIVDLKDNLLEFYSDFKITKDERAEFLKAFNDISSCIKRKFPKVRVYLYGSHAIGSANKDSDLDITILFHSENIYALSKEIKILKLQIIDSYFRSQNYSRMILITKARIPILKLVTENGVSVDISIDNYEALRNTHLLKAYSKLDSRVIVLGQLLKRVTKSYKIASVCEGTLSPFGYMLMLIHFLQKKHVLPVLDKKEIDYDPDECNQMFSYNKIKKASRDCEKSNIAKLWIGFFKYYTMEFDYRNDVVDITHSKRVSKCTMDWFPYLSIADPVSNNDKASHIKLREFNRIFNSFTDFLLHIEDCRIIF